MGAFSQSMRRGSSVSEGIRVIPLPDDDAEFGSRVKEAMADLDGNPEPDRGAILSVLGELKTTYPDVEVRQQDRLASFEVSPRTWYVYRDGIGRRHA